MSFVYIAIGIAIGFIVANNYAIEIRYWLREIKDWFKG